MQIPPAISRRESLFGLGASLGASALSTLLRADESSSAAAPLSPKAGHFPAQAKAKSVIFLMMEGGPSHLDTFDPKSKLKELHLNEFQRGGKEKSAMESGTRYYVESPFKFRRAGQSGADMAENWEHLAKVADEICFYRGCQGESVNHPTALYHMNTGNRFGGDPAIGAWMTYAWDLRTRTCQVSSCSPNSPIPRAVPPTGATDFCRLTIKGPR